MYSRNANSSCGYFGIIGKRNGAEEILKDYADLEMEDIDDVVKFSASNLTR